MPIDNGTVEGLNNKAKLSRTARTYIRNLYHCMADLPLPQTMHTFGEEPSDFTTCSFHLTNDEVQL